MFARWWSPRVVGIGIAITAVVRLLVVGGWSWWDLYAVALVLGLTPFTEWIIHLYLLHGEPRSYLGGAVRIGSGHREHHLDPNHIGWLLLRGADAAAFQVMTGLLVVAVTIPVPFIVGGSVLAPALTAVLAAQIKLFEYEWAHFLFHTAYRPRTRWYRRLKRNHRLHHYRNERYWLGVTHNFGDRILRTLPKHPSDVPLSSKSHG